MDCPACSPGAEKLSPAGLRAVVFSGQPGPEAGLEICSREKRLRLVQRGIKREIIFGLQHGKGLI